jgi:hypothetical protein
LEARRKRLKGTHRATGEALLPAAKIPQKRLTAVEFFVRAHFSSPRYTTKEESERASSPDFPQPRPPTQSNRHERQSDKVRGIRESWAGDGLAYRHFISWHETY